ALLEPRRRRGRVDRRRGEQLELEVLHVDRAVRRRDAIDPLADRLEAHVLEGRQREVERNRLVATERAEPEPLLVSAPRAVERDLERALAAEQPLHDLHVAARAGGVDLLLIGRGERALVAMEELERP